MRIDLHTHSSVSDGSDTPTALVECAAHRGLDVVALTDHDTTAGWYEAEAAARRVGIGLVTGVEFSTTNEGRGQHLLGYCFDADAPAVADLLGRLRTSREDRITALLTRLDELGLSVDRNYVRGLAGGIPSRKHVAAGMVRAGHARNDEEAFRLYLNEGGVAYVQRYRPRIENAIAAIKAAGGVSVIAHPRDGKRGRTVTDARFAELKAAGLDGIEVDHEGHSPEVREELRDVARSLGLVVTGSSDYHGTRKTGHGLGRQVTSVADAERLFGVDIALLGDASS